MDIKTMEKDILRRMNEDRWPTDPQQDALLLTEKVGELCREIRRVETGRERPDEKTASSDGMQEAIAEEIGDILFPLVKIAHHYGLSLEEAYKSHTAKMTKQDTKKQIMEWYKIHKLRQASHNPSVLPRSLQDEWPSEEGVRLPVFEWEALLEKAEKMATAAHKGQKDKGGHPYIEHPRRVAERMCTHPEKIVAWLHDVVEDTDWTLPDLAAEGFPLFIVDAVNAISKRDGETREEYLYRVSLNPLAKRVKMDGDLQENMDLSRIENPSPKDEERVKLYRHAYEVLRGAGKTHVFGRTYNGKRWVEVMPEQGTSDKKKEE